jgi:hypothetical protein
VEPRQPINASIARRIGSGSVGQAFMILTKFGSLVSNPVSAESGHSQFPVVFWESGQVGNLPHVEMPGKLALYQNGAIGKLGTILIAFGIECCTSAFPNNNV